jgi:hypothetical protein
MTDDEKLSSASFELLPAGAQVAGNRAECGPSVPAAADFEDIIIPSPPDQPRATYTSTLQAAVLFAQWSAVGLSEASRPGANRYRAPAIPFAAPVKTFSFASKIDLSPMPATGTFATRTEAADALRTKDLNTAMNFQLLAVRR